MHMLQRSLGNLATQFNSRSASLAPAAQALIDCDSETLARQLELARIPSPTGSEGARARAVAARFKKLGWQTEISAVGNVIARPPQRIDAPQSVHQTHDMAPIVCMAHLDSVFPEETALNTIQSGDRISCPGIGDNCRGLTAMLALAEVIGARSGKSSSLDLNRPIEFVATVGEEGLGNLRGAQDYFRERDNAQLPRVHAAIALDGPGDSNIVHHGLGSRRFRITFRGSGGHSWADFGSPNTVHAAAQATTWLAELPRTLNLQFAITVSRIGGGESINAIPSSSFMEVDIRATDEAVLQRAETELQSIVIAAAAAESTKRIVAPKKATIELTTNVECIGARPTGSLPVEHPLVRVAQFATRLYDVEPVSAVASTDANVPLSLGIPAITIGAGGVGGGAHTVHEWYENTNGPRGLARALTVVMAMAN